MTRAGGGAAGTAGTPAVTAGTLPTVVTAPTSSEFTIASYNLQRFYDTVDDGATDDVALTATAFANRLQKASLAIRNHLRAPDILGVQEVENLATLQALSAQISADAIAASQPDPAYVAYLSDGNDSGGIDVGYLVKTASVGGSTPRVLGARAWIGASAGAVPSRRPPSQVECRPLGAIWVASPETPHSR